MTARTADRQAEPHYRRSMGSSSPNAKAHGGARSSAGHYFQETPAKEAVAEFRRPCRPGEVRGKPPNQPRCEDWWKCSTAWRGTGPSASERRRRGHFRRALGDRREAGRRLPRQAQLPLAAGTGPAIWDLLRVSEAARGGGGDLPPGAGDREKLAADFPDMAHHRSDVAAVLSELGLLQARRGRDREAREAFERAYAILDKLVADHPDRSDYRRQLAISATKWPSMTPRSRALKDRDPARARRWPGESVELEPKRAGPWKGLALAEYRAGDFDAALEARTKSLELRRVPATTTTG